jgi:hypothetical protein
MVLLTMVGLSLLSGLAKVATGSFVALIPVLGISALLLQMGAETRWPRQSGSVRVAILSRATLRQTGEARYLVGTAVAGLFATVTLVFFLVVNPSVTQKQTLVCLTDSCPADSRALIGDLDAAPGVGSLVVAAGLTLVLAALAVLAIRQVLGRPLLDGVGMGTGPTQRSMLEKYLPMSFARR